MSKVYEYRNDKFTITEHDDCSIKVTREGYDKPPVIISADGSINGYRIAFSDKWRSLEKTTGSVEYSVEQACEMIYERLNHRPRCEELRSKLKDFYSRLEN